MPKTKVFKCVVCGGDIMQDYVVSCPVRKYCSKKCRWTFYNRHRGTHAEPTTKTKEKGGFVGVATWSGINIMCQFVGDNYELFFI